LDTITGISALRRDFCVLGATKGFDFPITTGVNSTAMSVTIRGFWHSLYFSVKISP